MARGGDGFAVELGQTVDIVVVGRGDTEVLRQVDDAHVVGDGMLLQEGLALAVAEAEEHHVDLVEGHRVGEAHGGLAVESLMDIGEQIAGIAAAVDKDQIGVGVVDEQTDEFAGGIAGSSQYSYSYHVANWLWVE